MRYLKIFYIPLEIMHSLLTFYWFCYLCTEENILISTVGQEFGQRARRAELRSKELDISTDVPLCSSVYFEK